MKRRTLVVFGVLVAGLVLAFLVSQIRGASARPITLKEILLPQSGQVAAPQMDASVQTTSAPQTSPTATVFPEGMPNPPTLEINWIIISPEQRAKNEVVLATARELIEKADQVYSTPGWWHLVSKTEIFFSLSDTLPDGSPMPMEWTDNNWYLIDANGEVMEAVGIQDTVSPKTTQISKFQDGIWTNITFGDTWDTGEKTYDSSLDSGFLADAERNKDIVELESKIAMLGEERVAVFTTTARNVKPVQMAKSDYWVMGTSSKYYFSLETGLLLQIEQYDITPEGQYKLIQRITTTLVEKVSEPPADLMKSFQSYSEQVSKNEAILENIKALTERANETYRAPGWWHSAYQIYYASSDRVPSTLPNGLPMPTEWREDSWILLNEKGYIIESVYIQDTASPETSQIRIYKDGIVTNPTFDMEWKGEPELASIGGGAPDISEMDINKVVLESKDTILGKEPVILFTCTTRGAPIILGGCPFDPSIVVGAYSKSYISKETGLPLLYEAYNILADGGSQLIHRIETLIYEKITEPPADVMKYLQ